MIRSILLGILVFIGAVATAQVQTHVVGDSVRVHGNSGSTGELIVENSTKNVNGFLYNKGNGRTEFREGLVKINDSMYKSGVDTLKFLNYWQYAGNSGTNPATHYLGTKDSVNLSIRTKGLQHLSVWGNGVVNIAASDTTSRPIFRFFPNGDFSAGTNNDYTANQNEQKNGIRFNKKLGILEIGISNNLDTSLNISQNTFQTSGLIINSDSHNTINSTMISSIISGDGNVIAPNGAVNWSIIAGERDSINGGVAKSILSGYGHYIGRGGVNSSLISGISNRTDSVNFTTMINGYLNRDLDSTYTSFINGYQNRFSGNCQFLSGVNLISQGWASTTLGAANVSFSSLTPIKLNQPVALKNYPLLAIGNSNSYSTIRSNALTMLYNGRTQINTTGYDVTLSQTDVTPKAALEIVSKTSGILIPKLTDHQRDSIISGDLQNGLLIYNSDSSRFQYYNGTRWRSLAEASPKALQTLTDSSTIVWDIANGNNAAVTLGGTSRTLTISHPVAGETYRFKIAQDGTGSRTIGTWPSNTLWPSGAPPTLSTTASAIDMVTLYYDGANYFGDSKLLFQPVSTGVTLSTYDAKTSFVATVHSLTSVPAGTLLVLTTTAGSSQQNATISSSPSLTWTKRVDATTANSGDAEIWTAVFSAGGSISITSDWGNQPQSSVCYQIRNQESTLGGATASATLQGTPSVSITTTRANSLIIAVTSDWSAKSGTHTYSGSPTETLYSFYTGTGTFYHYYKAATTATSYTVGLSAPGSQASGTAVIEIRGN